jgi:predicted transcriptional regulator YheO
MAFEIEIMGPTGETRFSGQEEKASIAHARTLSKFLADNCEIAVHDLEKQITVWANGGERHTAAK